MSSSKVKSSNTILNILVIAVGIIFLFRAIIDFLTLAGLILPTILEDWATAVGGVAALGGQGLVSLVLAIWCIISGTAMFKEAEWAMGQALVVLSIMVATGVAPVIGLIMDPASFDLADVSTLINIIAFIVGIVGFIWLLITRRRYD
ncbi:MAG: hypothetical protein HWN80_04285 [Candidatus Lokiarchaeota archaeon]|nr:hypothetical protein [Candidatus Lokiarchaeota archaeon]